MNRSTFILAGSLVSLAVFLVLLFQSARTQPVASAEPLVLFCAASNRAVMEAIRSDYEQESGNVVQIQYGPSQTLLSSFEVSKSGDLYLPADDSYLMTAAEKKLIAEQIPIAAMRAVVAVRKGNPRSITAFTDLLRSDVRLVQASPDAAAIGRITRETLQKQGVWQSVADATVAYRTTVTDVANDLMVGAADAGIVYDAVLHSYPDLESVQIPELDGTVSQVSIAVLVSSKQPARALHFARYVAAKDKGLKRYAEHGFQTADGDAWSDIPEISLFAGSMLRPAIEDTIIAFEQREGVRVSRVYNGCGILVAQIHSGQHPDAYFACDLEFMNQVPDLFPQAVNVSQNELVILVRKGNPKGIAELKDLGREGLRVGVGHEKQCAMGWLTQKTLKEGGLQDVVMNNVTVQTPTGDMLVNQLRTGSLDAAVVYLSNAAGAADDLDAVQIQDLPCSTATQPFAVSRETRYPRLAARLFTALRSEESQHIFEAEGFRWQP
jgi:molybdate transport system substrate-binding protein